MANVKFIAVSRGLRGIVDYVTNREKTVEQLISGVNCVARTAVPEFEAVKKQFRKTEGRGYYHIVQAFAPDDPLDFATAHELGVKLVNRINGELVVSQPKTPNSIRKLAIPQRAVELLVEEHAKHPHSPHLFVSPKTGTMFDPDSFRHTHEKILKAIGAEHIRFHDLRHTFATLSLKYGVDVKTLSGALGHYDAGFTLSTYTHATEGMKRSAADAIGNVISQAM